VSIFRPICGGARKILGHAPAERCIKRRRSKRTPRRLPRFWCGRGPLYDDDIQDRPSSSRKGIRLKLPRKRFRKKRASPQKLHPGSRRPSRSRKSKELIHEKGPGSLRLSMRQGLPNYFCQEVATVTSAKHTS